jgi:hypothetical protein
MFVSGRFFAEITAPTDMALLTEVNSVGASGLYGQVFQQQNVSSGATGNRVATYSSSEDRVAQLISISPKDSNRTANFSESGVEYQVDIFPPKISEIWCNLS